MLDTLQEAKENDKIDNQQLKEFIMDRIQTLSKDEKVSDENMKLYSVAKLIKTDDDLLSKLIDFTLQANAEEVPIANNIESRK
jgi:hypothetical protein